jgi:hypothetical protein
MTDRRVRTAGPLVAPFAILLAVGWFDSEFLAGVVRQASARFDPTQTEWLLPFGYMAAAAGILAIALIGFRSAGWLVGVVYVLVGLAATFLVTLTWQLSATTNGRPPVLPKPLADLIGQVYFWADAGPTRAFFAVGAGILLVGLGVLARALAERGRRAL